MLTIPPEATAKEVLKAVNTWADNAELKQAKQLWFILTALRGPDNGSDNLKSATTALVRGYSLPDLARRGGADYQYVEEPDIRELAEGVQKYDGQRHFLTHIWRAAQSLLDQYVSH